VDDVLNLALGNIDNLPPNPTAGAWFSMLRLLSKDKNAHHCLNQAAQWREQQLSTLFFNTQ
jgi:hypothetical protein